MKSPRKLEQSYPVANSTMYTDQAGAHLPFLSFFPAYLITSENQRGACSSFAGKLMRLHVLIVALAPSSAVLLAS